MTNIDARTDSDFDSDANKVTSLSILRDELKKEIENPPATYVVLGRPHIQIRYNTNVDSGLLQLWRKRSFDKSMPDGLNQLKFVSTLLANQCEMILMDGKEAFGETNGDPITFRNPELLEMFQVATAVEGVKAMYVSDGHIIQVAEKLLSAAGYDADTEIEAESFLGK